MLILWCGKIQKEKFLEATGIENAGGNLNVLDDSELVEFYLELNPLRKQEIRDLAAELERRGLPIPERS